MVWGYNKTKKDGKDHEVEYNKDTKEHWSADIEETPVSGWHKVSNLHHTDDTKDKSDDSRFDWKDPGRSTDMYSDDSKSTDSSNSSS